MHTQLLRFFDQQIVRWDAQAASQHLSSTVAVTLKAQDELWKCMNCTHDKTKKAKENLKTLEDMENGAR